MGILDIIIVVCLLPGIYFGIKNGLIKQVIAIVAIFLGIFLSGEFSGEMSVRLTSGLLKNAKISPEWVRIISLVLIFIISALIVGLIGTLIVKVIQATSLHALDRILGIVFGVVEAGLAVCLLVYLANSVNDLVHFIPEKKIAESKLYPWFLNLFDKLFPYIANLLH